MEKDQIDQLYHLLRQLSNESADPSDNIDRLSKLTPSQEAAAIKGLVNHLDKDNYSQLLSFCSMYGMKYILPSVIRIIRENEIHPARFIDVGCGNGWLGSNLGVRFNTSYKLVDKREHIMGIEVLDLETHRGLEAFKDMLDDYDIITMCDFLHCVNNPEEILSALHDHHVVVVEYVPSLVSHMESYKAQLQRYGATPFNQDEIRDLLFPRVLDMIDIDPYEIYLLCEGE